MSRRANFSPVAQQGWNYGSIQGGAFFMTVPCRPGLLLACLAGWSLPTPPRPENTCENGRALSHSYPIGDADRLHRPRTSTLLATEPIGPGRDTCDARLQRNRSTVGLPTATGQLPPRAKRRRPRSLIRVALARQPTDKLLSPVAPSSRRLPLPPRVDATVHHPTM